MDWTRLEEDKCPRCARNLMFRLKGNRFRIKVNEGATTAPDDSWYFCSRCEGFQISQTRRNEILKGLENNRKKEFKDDPLFSSGLLRF